MGIIDSGLDVKNPNMNPTYFRQKDVTVDTFFESAKLSLIIEMQATRMCKNLWNRFILYMSIVLSRFIHSGQKYKDVKPVCMILFTNHYDKRHPSLIVEKTWIDKAFGTLVNQSCQKIYMIQIPYIEEIIKTRRELTLFEAFIICILIIWMEYIVKIMREY